MVSNNWPRVHGRTHELAGFLVRAHPNVKESTKAPKVFLHIFFGRLEPVLHVCFEAGNTAREYAWVRDMLCVGRA